jgi:hypothetical protein
MARTMALHPGRARPPSPDFLTDFWKAKGCKGDFRLDFAESENTSSKIEDKQLETGEVQTWLSG